MQKIPMLDITFPMAVKDMIWPNRCNKNYQNLTSEEFRGIKGIQNIKNLRIVQIVKKNFLIERIKNIVLKAVYIMHSKIKL